MFLPIFVRWTTDVTHLQAINLDIPCRRCSGIPAQIGKCWQLTAQLPLQAHAGDPP